MNAETLKDFLISLGFSVDEAGAKKFDSVIAGTTLKAIELGVKVEAAALSVVAYTAKIASGLDNLYWASQRTGATVNGIKQIGYAISQVGGTVDGARGSLESLARFVRNNPGAEGFLNRLGVQTRDAKGNMRDMASIFTGVGQRLSSMPYYRANQYAQMLGIDENTLMAMRRGIGQFSGEYTAMAKAIGYNADAAAVSSNHFMTSLRSFGQMAGMARDKIGSNLAGGLAGSIDTLRRQILDNFPKIEGAITAGVKGVLWFGEVIGRIVYRLIQITGDIINWWKSLNAETRQVIEVFGALVVAWRLLNSAFAMSPIGRVIMLGTALLSLYDDYRTWKEGGQSLIDWSKWEPGIRYAQKAFSSLSKDFGAIYLKVKDLGSAIVDLGKRFLEFINIDTSKFNGKWLFDQIIESVRSSIKILGSLVDALRKVINGDFSGAWDSLKGAVAAWRESPIIQGAVTVGQGVIDRVTGQTEGSGNTLADRNNNPGNIRPVGGGGFRNFESALHGWAAMKNQLMRYFDGKTTGRRLQSVLDIVSTWAPAGDNNNPQQYARQVAGWMGVSPTAALNLTDPRTMGALMQSMARKEGYSNWQSPLAYRAAGATLNQETNIHIHGVSDPREAGKLVADSQGNVNSLATQQLNRSPG